MPPELAPPPNVDAVVPVVLGTLAWALALLVGLLADLGATWTALCATSTGLGLVGCVIVLRRRATYRRAGRSTSGQG